MADPITWGLLNLIKKRVKGVQTTLDGVSDKVSGLPDSLDADFTEVKDAIADVKVDVGNVNIAVGDVKGDTASIKNTIDGSKLLTADSVVKKIQRGVYRNTVETEDDAVLVTISPITLSKSILITNYTSAYESVLYLDSSSIRIADKVNGALYFSWEVIEFY